MVISVFVEEEGKQLTVSVFCCFAILLFSTVHALAVRVSSYGCTKEIRRPFVNLELLLRFSRVALKFPRATTP